MASKEGKIFEESIETSCKEQNIFYSRIKDVFVPPDLRERIRVPKNKYDCLLYFKNTLFPIEFKSIKDKNISVKDPKIIKPHQIEALQEATKFKGTIPGFIINFRSYDNQTFFIHIDNFIEYKNCALDAVCKREYKSKVNKSSLSLDIAREIGTELNSVKKKVKYRYLVKDLLNELIDTYKKEV